MAQNAPLSFHYSLLRNRDKKLCMHLTFMARLKAFAFLLSLLVAVTPIPAAASVGEGGRSQPLGWIPFPSGCRGTIAECLAGNEFELGSEANRRILANSNYISYGALRRDSTPCSRRGASYYNCRPGAQANPYSRSCSAISQCRG